MIVKEFLSACETIFMPTRPLTPASGPDERSGQKCAMDYERLRWVTRRMLDPSCSRSASHITSHRSSVPLTAKNTADFAGVSVAENIARPLDCPKMGPENAFFS